MKSVSRLAWICSAVCILLVSFWYYPKWNKSGSEATISWDASGYYMYLPAIFVHHDVKELTFRDEVITKYQPSPRFDQAFLHPGSGHYVMKYSSGLAMQYLPFFLTAHLLAAPLGFAADGFSPPYQLAIQLGSILMCLLGLWLVRRALLPRFGEWPTALTLLLLVVGTNYLDYAAINGAMTHNWLFTWYSALLLLTPAFYRRPTLGKALAIGGIVGLMTLTRPTDSMALLIPMLWGLAPAKALLQARLDFWARHWPKLVAAAAVGAAVVSIQPLYWHYVTGEWVVYSYQDQGFSWLRPHLWNGIFSFRSGWLLYSPLSVTPLLGLLVLRRREPEGFWAILIFAGVAIYVSYAWDVWWYGGRAMVQSYAVLAWPMAALLQWLGAHRRWAVAYAVFALAGCYFNIWLTHASHLGGMYVQGDMSRAYLWRVVGRWHMPAMATRLLLDSNGEYTGTPSRQQVLWQQNFEQANAAECAGPALEGRCSFAVDTAAFHPGAASAPPVTLEQVIPLKAGEYDWVRASLDARCEQLEPETARMTQYTVSFRLGSQVVKERMVRLQRALEPGWPQNLHIDVHTPGQHYDKVVISLQPKGSPYRLLVDRLEVTGLTE